jgi:single-stranded-DNA-specific exonuclease
VTGIDLGAQIQKLASEGHLTKGGGHKMAAGLSLTRAQLEPAMARLAELMARQGAGDLGPKDLRLDGILMPAAAQVELVELLEQAGPFGAGAAGPPLCHARGENPICQTRGQQSPKTAHR